MVRLLRIDSTISPIWPALAVHHDDRAELVAGKARQRVAGRQIARQAPRDRQKNRIAEGKPDRLVDLLEAVDVDHQHGGRRGAGPTRGDQRRVEPVEKQFAIGQAGQIVVHRVMQHALFGGLDFGDVGQRADDANDFALGVDHRARLHHEPEIMAVGGAQPDIVIDAPASLLQQPVERRLVAIAIHRMQHFEP